MNNSIMTVSEVAEYLKLSDKTVLKMVKEKSIPCAKVGNQWRFVKEMLDDWLVAKMNVLPQNDLSRLINMNFDLVPLSRLTRESLILTDIKSGSKKEVLRQLIQPVLSEGLVSHEEKLLQGLLDREEMASTALGHGIALPHLRKPNQGISEGPSISIGICKEGAAFDAVDKKLTHLFFLILSDSEIVHLRLMSRIGQLIRNREIYDNLVALNNPHEIMEYLIQRENLLLTHQNKE